MRLSKVMLMEVRKDYSERTGGRKARRRGLGVLREQETARRSREMLPEEEEETEMSSDARRRKKEDS